MFDNSRKNCDGDYLQIHQCQSKLGLHLTPVIEFVNVDLCIKLYFKDMFRFFHVYFKSIVFVDLDSCLLHWHVCIELKDESAYTGFHS